MTDSPFLLQTYDYILPPERIATHPAVPRDAAKLLVSDGVTFDDRIFSDLPDLLQAGDVLVVNNSKVIPARLHGLRAARRGAAPVPVEILLHQPVGDFTQWRCFARPAKRLRTDELIHFAGNVTARVTGRDDAQVLISFDGLTAADVESFLEEHGEVPLPPYIARAEEKADKQEYQTVYAAPDAAGSVAAPTAGLHFTDALLQRLRDKGVALVTVTLHVGAGTFLPVMVDDIRQHKMHTEWGSLSPEAAATIHEAKARGRHVVAVGTTATRVLESAAQQAGGFAAWQGDTAIFITPGFRFQIVDRLITNFHLPKSTLLMLVAAFLGDVAAMQRLYAHAMDGTYRFYSYGDACLLTCTPSRVS